MTFGYDRSAILAAGNGMSLLIITVVILWEAYGRLQHPEPVNSTWMFVSKGVGLVMNLYLGLGMRHEENRNVKSAVCICSGMRPRLRVSSPEESSFCGKLVCRGPDLSVLIALLIAVGAWRIVKQTLRILMEGTPQGRPPKKEALRGSKNPNKSIFSI